MRNTGVTVSLIVFMVLSLILGVTTYIGAKGTSEKKMEVASLKKQTSEAQSLNSSMKSDLSGIKEKLGYGAVEDNNQLVETMKTDVVAALGTVEDNASYREAVSRLAENLKWKKKRSVVGVNLDEINGDTINYASEQLKAEDLDDSHNQMTDDQQKNFADVEGDIKREHSDALTAANTSKEELSGSLAEQKKELDAVETKTKEEIRVAKQETADWKESADKFQGLNEQLRKKADELANVDFTRADAKIVYADQVLKTARLNVGEKDGVRPMTTFNVFNPDAIDMGTEVAKGSVQVVRSIGDHLCEAKILEDEMSNPIMPGDLVYTPLWRPGKKVKYALDYKLDIDGDGLSDLDQIMSIIQSSGAEVAAYIDDDGKPQGEITNDVYRVIRADQNITDTLAHDSSRNEEQRESLQREDQKFLDQAKELGIEEIFLADFLKSIGYKETAKITRYRELNGVDLQDNGVIIPDVSNNPVAPKYELDPDKAPKSPGIVSPDYLKDAQPAPVSSGKVSDYYYRKRDKQAQ